MRCAGAPSTSGRARPGGACGRESCGARVRRESAAVTAAALTSMMLGTVRAVCRRLPARASSASSSRCARGSARKRRCQRAIAHEAAQLLVGVVVGAQRIAVREQHALAVELRDHRVGEAAGSRCARRSPRRAGSRGCRAAQSTPRRARAAPAAPRQTRSLSGRGHHPRPRPRTGRRGCRALRACARFVAQKVEELLAGCGALASRCTSETNRRAIGSTSARECVFCCGVGDRGHRRCTGGAPPATMISIFSMMTGFSGASDLNGPDRAGGRLADAVDHVHALHDAAEHRVAPAGGHRIEVGVVDQVHVELRSCPSAARRRAPGPPCRACSAGRCRIR